MYSPIANCLEPLATNGKDKKVKLVQFLVHTSKSNSFIVIVLSSSKRAQNNYCQRTVVLNKLLLHVNCKYIEKQPLFQLSTNNRNT